MTGAASSGSDRSVLAQPLLGTGEVRHMRHRPVANGFVYPTYFLLLPMRRLRANAVPALRRNRFGLLAFHDCDHGAGGVDSLDWIEVLLASHGIADADGEIWLHCYPRVLGFAFKPVSFWYCHRDDGALAAVVVEVNNTFGERHCYLLHGPELAFGREVRAAKVFHVSPFCAVAGDYRFRFMRTGLHPQAADPRKSAGATAAPRPRTVARIDHHDDYGLLLQTSVSGSLQVLTPRAIRYAFCTVPLLTVGMLVKIHWQALRLWFKRIPFFAKPAPPDAFVSP